MIRFCRGRLNLFQRIANLEKGQRKLTMDLSNFSTNFTKFAGDFGTFKTDLTAFLKTLPTPDPAQQAVVDGFTTQLGDMDTSVQAMDASLKPAA